MKVRKHEVKILAMNKNRKSIWRICLIVIVISIALTFSPLVIPANTYEPMLWNIPYTMWMGFFWSLFLFVLMIVAIQFHPAKEEEQI